MLYSIRFSSFFEAIPTVFYVALALGPQGVIYRFSFVFLSFFVFSLFFSGWPWEESSKAEKQTTRIPRSNPSTTPTVFMALARRL